MRLAGTLLAAVLWAAVLVVAVSGATAAPVTTHSAGTPRPDSARFRSHGTPPPSTGEEIFRATCAACHGADGKGAPQTAVGFVVPTMPDFTDCRATARETTADWAATIRDGGPVRGFNRIMPAFRDLLTPDQIQRVVAYLRTLCTDPRWPVGEFNVPLAQTTEKAFPEDEIVFKSIASTRGPTSIENHLIWEKRFFSRSQLEVDIPFAYTRRPAASWAAGLGDATLALKQTFVANIHSGTIVSTLTGVVLPTGDQTLGLGSGTPVFEGYLLGAQLLPGRSFFQFQGGVSLPKDPALAPRTVSWSGALGKTFPVGPITRIWSPMIELAGSRDLASGAPVDWNAVPQLQVSLSALQHVRANLGANVPLTHRDTRHPQILAYLLWDTFDGPLFFGWNGWCPGCEH